MLALSQYQAERRIDPIYTQLAQVPYAFVHAPLWGAFTGSPNVENGDNRLERSTAAPFHVFNVAQKAGVQLPAGPPLIHCLAMLSVIDALRRSLLSLQGGCCHLHHLCD